jgi:hypothetical protein
VIGSQSKKPLIAGAVMTLILVTSCNTITRKQAETEFLRACPECTILSSGPGEGNADQVYYDFRFRKPNDDKPYHEIWLFMRQPDNTWKVTHREFPTD